MLRLPPCTKFYHGSQIPDQPYFAIPAFIVEIPGPCPLFLLFKGYSILPDMYCQELFHFLRFGVQGVIRGWNHESTQVNVANMARITPALGAAHNINLRPNSVDEKHLTLLIFLDFHSILVNVADYRPSSDPDHITVFSLTLKSSSFFL